MSLPVGGNIIKVYDKVNNLLFHGDGNDNMEEYRLCFEDDGWRIMVYIAPKFMDDKNLRWKSQAYFGVSQTSEKENRYVELRVSKYMIEYTEEDLDRSCTLVKKQTVNLESGNVYTSETVFSNTDKEPSKKNMINFENNKGERNLKFKIKENILSELLTKLKKNGKQENGN